MKYANIIAVGIMVASVVAWAADEININATLKVDNGYLSDQRRVSNLQVDQSSAKSAAGVQLIGTNLEVVTYQDLTTPGWAYFRNLQEDTNTIRLAVGVSGAGTNYFAFIDDGEVAMFRVATGAVIFASATAENCKLDKMILED